MPRLLLPLAAALTLLPAGCDSGPQVVPVRGTVTRHGKPVPNCTVNFVPAAGRPSWGKSDDGGNFTLSYDPQRNGALVGRHKVHVEFRVTSPEDEALRAAGKWKLPPDQKEILDKYGQAGQPAIEVEVIKGGPPIEIKLD